MKAYRFILWLSIAISLILGIQKMDAKDTAIATPDFAFPNKVSSQAEKDLKSALRKGDGPTTLRAIMDYGLAQGCIDTDNLPTVLSRINSLHTDRNTSAVTSAMLSLLEATIYQQLYLKYRWKYDNRDIPITQLSDDYTEWSGEQFKGQIQQLIDTALSADKQLKKESTTQWSSVISITDSDIACFPTLYDFVAYQSLDLINKLNLFNTHLSINWLCKYSIYTQLQFRYASPIVQKVLNIYKELLTLHSDNPTALIYADVSRINFIKRYVIDSDTADTTQFDLLMDIYRQYDTYDFAGYILQSAGNAASTLTQQRNLYDAISKFLDNHKQNSRWAVSLKGIQKTLTHERISTTYRGTIVPGDDLTINIKAANVSSATVGLFYLQDDPALNRATQYSFNGKTPAPTLIESRKLSFAHNHDIFTADTTITFTMPAVGRYVVMPLLNGTSCPKNTPAAIIRCTAITLLSGNNHVIATNPKDGAPISDVSLKLMSYQNNQLHTYKTDNDGWADIPITQGASYILGIKGNDSISVCHYNSWRFPTNESLEYHGRIYTDLPIYHPNDIVRFVSLVYRCKNKDQKQLSPQTIVTARLWNANHQQIDSIQLTTDRFGRIESKFNIPADGLTGRYRITLERSAQDIIANQSFTVSDYKLPTFEVKGLQYERGIPTTGDITISGKATTYSDFPISSAKVILNLSVAKRYWWHSTPDNSFYTIETETDAKGNFSFILPKDLLDNAPIVNGIYTANITVTSVAGESQTAVISFTQGKSYSLEASLPDDVDITSGNINLPIRVTDAMGHIIEHDIEYRLVKNNTAVNSGIISSANPIVDWSNVASGQYMLMLSIDTDTVKLDNITLYRPTDKMPPKTTPLWIPKTDISVARGSSAHILYGTTNPSAHILVVVSDNDSIISRRWITPTPGNHTYEVAMPTSDKMLRVTLSTISDYTFTTKTVTITANDIAKSLDVSISSFRDHIIPGDKETWTISVTDNLGTPQSAAVVLDMYAKAIDRLASSDWEFSVDGYYPQWRFNINAPQTFKIGTSTQIVNTPDIKYTSIFSPKWQLYNRSFTSTTLYNETTDLRIRGSVRQTKLYSASRATYDSGNDVSVESTADTSAAVDDMTSEQNVDNESFRMPEMPIALFEPMLTTDANGHLNYSFTAPNANTTWKLCALAISHNLLSGTFTGEITSNKPIMVKPNLPRFMRTGDCAIINASVMNNTDTTLLITTQIEIFDPMTNETSVSQIFTSSIEGHQSTIVAIKVNADTNMNMLGYRIRSHVGQYSDGEQSLIAILPSSTPVIESHPFYMTSTDTQLSVQLPQMPEEARITLQFCQNPTWYCVTALPGLLSDESNSALSASAAIFSAAIANGLLKSQPELRKALHYWTTGDKNDSTLMSMLERNQDLKTILLNATPWMMDARSQTERMTRLALLFDRNEIANAYAKNISILAKLQRSNGGWSWTEHTTEPSIWITYNVLNMMGRLKQLGWLPDNKQLTTMIERAVSYIDDYNAREFVRYPKSNYLQYVNTRDYFTDIKQSSAAKRVTSATIQNIISDWKEQSIPTKAISAIILNNHGYNATARQAIASLREYAKITPTNGMWWPSLDDYTVCPIGKISGTAVVLDAFTAVEHGCVDIDLIRQWLILQKESKDWGTSVSTTSAIASILSSGSHWTVPAHQATITIDRHDIEPSYTDAMIGYLRTDISNIDHAASTLSITKAPAGPAWGAIYSQYTGDMSEISAKACEAVSINKQIYVQQSITDGIKWIPATELKVGNRVKIQLTIKSTRDMDYVAIIDDRAAAFEPIEQLPTPIYSEGLCFYRENRDASTRIFVTHMPKGTYLLTYELFVNNSGVYSSGIASIQSQYAPQITAHSAGSTITINE